MTGGRILRCALLLAVASGAASGAATAAATTAGAPAAANGSLKQQNDRMFAQMQTVHHLSDAQMDNIRAIFARSGYAGQGNPAISQHPDTPVQCQSRLAKAGIDYANPRFEKICHAPYMAPLYDPRTQRPEDAKACIDQFEFPDIPCAYPVVWVRAREAAQICEAEGKRLCDAHEWEGACAGALEPPDYRFDLAQGVAPEQAVARMRAAHNRADEADKRWSYGPAYRTGVCATASHKTPGCPGGGWNKCGSNTYPDGDFPGCRSALDVYDLNGNVAEHMNLPLAPSQMASRGSKTLGYTEMKGSWFVFDSIRAHPDWCRWRAPYWHGSRVMDEHSHANYHLGFRCCKDP
jgi:formylglycine-generating enzyme required for sulfatase activity